MRTRIVAALLIQSFAASIGSAQTAATPPAVPREAAVTQRARGTFEVKLTPQPADTADGPRVGRMTIDKQFHGDLDGVSRGEMLAFMTEAPGSAGYVAMERVTAALSGRKGSFVLQHTGTMDRGKAALSVHVVPDSGTHELTGLTGTMNIIIADGKHSYEMDYKLPSD